MLWKIDFKVIQSFALKLLLMTSRTTILGIQEKYCPYAHDSLKVAIKNKTKNKHMIDVSACAHTHTNSIQG